MTLSIMTLSIMTLSIKGLFVTLRINDTQHNNTDVMLMLCCAECCALFTVMLNVVIISVFMLNVIMLSVFILNVVMLNVVILSVFTLNVITLSVVGPPLSVLLRRTCGQTVHLLPIP
jgi:hypothetical protein